MPEVGDTLGRYTLLKKLAEGGMGQVFLAAKPGPVGFGPIVALKVLRDSLATDPAFVEMLIDEANVSMFLSHQNVVSVLDLGEDHRRYYIAMEYVQGVNLEQLLESRGSALDVSTTLFIASELCRALKYAHSRVDHEGEPLAIIHRDVAPSNILLSTQGEVKLTDFGMARAKRRLHETQAGIVKGRLGYLAPEVVRGQSFDARADLFSTGVVIYFMLTGRHPLSGVPALEAMNRFETKSVPPPSTINSDIASVLDGLVMRCLEPLPEARFGSAAELGEALQLVIFDNPVWRREAQAGSKRIIKEIQECFPELFEDPVAPAELAALFERSDAVGASPGAPALPGDPRGRSSKSGRAKPTGTEEEAETDTDEDAVSKEAVAKARAQLAREAASSRGMDLTDATSFDDDTRDAHESVTNAFDDATEALGVVLAVPERKTIETSKIEVEVEVEVERETVGEKIGSPLVERDTPSTLDSDPGLAFLESSTDRNKVKSSKIEEPLHPGDLLRSDTLGDSMNGDEDPDALTRKSISSPGQYGEDDNRTLIGVTLSASSPDDVVDGRRGQRKSEPKELMVLEMQEPLPSEAEAQSVPGEGDATLLDLRMSDVQAQLDEDLRHKPVVASLSSAEPRHKVTSAPRLLDGPVRIVMNEQGQPHLARSDALSLAGSGAKADKSEKRGGRPAREVNRPAALSMPASQPAGPSPPDLEVGSLTSRWIAGEVDGRELDWSDDAAARRAVGSRGAAYSQAAPVPLVQHVPGAMPPTSPLVPAVPAGPAAPPSPVVPAGSNSTSSFQQNWMVIIAFVAALLAVSAVVYVAFGTSFLWPKLRLESDPPGALVVVDRVRSVGKTPVPVRVEPGRPHTIEFILDGYRTETREIKEGVARAKTYIVRVGLRRIPPRMILPVTGRAFINGASLGEGSVFDLVDLPAGKITVRVEFDEFETYEVTFDAIEKIPSSFNVPTKKKRSEP